MDAVNHLAPAVGVVAACEVLGVARASFYRQLRSSVPPTFARQSFARRPPGRCEPTNEPGTEVLHPSGSRIARLPPSKLLCSMKASYLCSTRTMYRLLEQDGATRERRDQLLHPAYQKPELLAAAPNRFWSWDITKLRGPAKWTYFYLYVILDVFSRYIVGWMVAPREGAGLASKLIEETCEKQIILPDQLTIHADRGSSMRSKPVAFLLADLSITKTHSRPYMSDDNPYSESQFRTMKYRPEFPDRFGSIQDARAFGQTFFAWYNDEHRHSGIGMMTPAMVHYGQAPAVGGAPTVLDAAFMRIRTVSSAGRRSPYRFPRRCGSISRPNRPKDRGE